MIREADRFIILLLLLILVTLFVGFDLLLRKPVLVVWTPPNPGEEATDDRGFEHVDLRTPPEPDAAEPAASRGKVTPLRGKGDRPA